MVQKKRADMQYVNSNQREAIGFHLLLRPQMHDGRRISRIRLPLICGGSVTLHDPPEHRTSDNMQLQHLRVKDGGMLFIAICGHLVQWMREQSIA